MNALIDVEKLNPQDGDVVVIRANISLFTQTADEIIEDVKALFKDRKITVCILPKGMGMEVLNEEEMRAQGWVRDKPVPFREFL